jgi:hypothetical protein
VAGASPGSTCPRSCRGTAAEARERDASGAEKGKAETLARLDVQIAIARLGREKGWPSGPTAPASRRILRARYERGLTDAAMLLRSAEAVEQADTQQIAARVNVITATATLQRTIGRP